MSEMKAKAFKDDVLVHDDLDIWLEVANTGDLKSWFGEFEVHLESKLTLMGNGNPRFTLTLTDGRSGQFLITNESVDFSSTTKRIVFKGTGPLAVGAA